METEQEFFHFLWDVLVSYFFVFLAKLGDLGERIFSGRAVSPKPPKAGRLGEPALPLEWKETLEGEAVPNRMPRACWKTAHHRFALQFVVLCERMSWSFLAKLGGLGERMS